MPLRRVDGRRRTSRATTDHEHVRWPWRRGSSAARADAPVSTLARISSTVIRPLTEVLAVEEDRRHRHDLAFIDEFLEQRPSIIVLVTPG